MDPTAYVDSGDLSDCSTDLFNEFDIFQICIYAIIGHNLNVKHVHSAIYPPASPQVKSL